jgi:hypothetical protein
MLTQYQKDQNAAAVKAGKPIPFPDAPKPTSLSQDQVEANRAAASAGKPLPYPQPHVQNAREAMKAEAAALIDRAFDEAGRP